MDEVEQYDVLDVSDISDEEIDYNIIVENDDVEDIEEFKKNYGKNKNKNITTPKLSKYEKTRILCERTHQIEGGSVIYISDIQKYNDAYSIAVEEFNQKKIPFIIRRPLPNNNSYEYWKLSDMLY
jgi:DNA-directed RNA polymerases I, II, and III subunit RPABC2